MKVEKINHVAIMVKDLEKAGKFFADLFDTEFGPWGHPEGEEEDTKEIISPLGICLAAPHVPDGPAARFLDRRGEGMVALVLKVPNLEEAIADMESHGVRLINRGEFLSVKLGSVKIAEFHPRDVHGVSIGLIEY